jgi:hypothetical protein
MGVAYSLDCTVERPYIQVMNDATSTETLTYEQLDQLCTELLVQYEAADQAVLDAHRRGAPRAERLALRAEADRLEAELDAMCERRNAAAPPIRNEW